MNIRKAKEEDFQTICNFIDAIDDFEATLTPILSNSPEERKAVRENVKKYLEDPNFQMFIAEVDGKPVGMITAEYKPNIRAKFTRRKMGLLTHLFVHPDFRKQGIATKLIGTAKQSLREKGVDWFQAYVRTTNTPSLNTLKKTGFEPYSYIMHEYE